MQKIMVQNLQPGMRLDLAGDPVADPEHEARCFEFDYAIVDSVEQETDDCFRVDFENSDSIGFPVNHELAVDL